MCAQSICISSVYLKLINILGRTSLSPFEEILHACCDFLIFDYSSVPILWTFLYQRAHLMLSKNDCLVIFAMIEKFCMIILNNNIN